MNTKQTKTPRLLCAVCQNMIQQNPQKTPAPVIFAIARPDEVGGGGTWYATLEELCYEEIPEPGDPIFIYKLVKAGKYQPRPAVK